MLENLWRTVDRCLTAQLLEHFSSTGQPVTRFADGDVEHEFLDAELPHGIGAFIFLRLYGGSELIITITVAQ